MSDDAAKNMDEALGLVPMTPREKKMPASPTLPRRALRDAPGEAPRIIPQEES